MKKVIAIIIILIMTVAALVPVSAQNVNVNIHINLDRQPAWGPIGYEYVDFYYFPDINVYFDVNHHLFYYVSGRRWVSAPYLPPKYRQYDLYCMYKVVINEPTPWHRNSMHKKGYAHYRNDRTQVVIRHTTDHKYSNSRRNTINWVDDNRTSNKNKTTNQRVTTSQSSSSTKQNTTVRSSESNKKQPTSTNRTTSGRSNNNSSTNRTSTNRR